MKALLERGATLSERQAVQAFKSDMTSIMKDVKAGDMQNAGLTQGAIGVRLKGVSSVEQIRETVGWAFRQD